MTSWHRNEYILKGVFLGLWVFFALQVPADSAAARIDILWVVGWVCAGLAIALRRRRRPPAGRAGCARGTTGPRSRSLVLLESPTFIYAGIMVGLVVGVLSGTPGAEPWAGKLAGYFGLTFDDIKHATSQALPDDDPQKGKLPGDWLTYCVARRHRRRVRPLSPATVRRPPALLGLGMGLVAVMVAIAAEYVSKVPGLDNRERPLQPRPLPPARPAVLLPAHVLRRRGRVGSRDHAVLRHARRGACT